MNENTKAENKTISCAIYTRKSTSEGLEQDFTSLDAQRESCESYIASQKTQGWVISAEKYNDGGYTGANTDRPALQKLISDIETGKINCVVVYKVDRLSRSLLDFVKLLELFEQKQVTFVSVTQAFNTQNSMGRLTLNILLSFAQFEREIISERTKDKMAAARKKGKFVGGRPALGYDLDYKNHILVINKQEAEVIKRMFALYLEKKSLNEVAKILNNEGYRTKKFFRKGKTEGGIPLKNTNIQLTIRNPLYIGKVRYNDQLYDGLHEAIITEDIFNNAQRILTANCRFDGKNKTKNSGILSQILRCKSCNCAMFYTYAKKKNKKYHYYLCCSAQKRGYHTCPSRLVNAQAIENAVINKLREIYPDKQLHEQNWAKLLTEEKQTVISRLIKEANYDANNKTLAILSQDGKTCDITIDLQPKPKSRKALKEEIKNEPALRQNLLLAYQIQSLLETDKTKGLKQITEWLGISNVKMCLIMDLLMLSPTIQESIISGDGKNISSIPEYKINKISHEVYWQKQQEMWQELTGNPAR